jgi:hypothetical protein
MGSALICLELIVVFLWWSGSGNARVLNLVFWNDPIRFQPREFSWRNACKARAVFTLQAHPPIFRPLTSARFILQ